MDFSQLQAMDHSYIANTYARFPVGIASGTGAVCTGLDGRRYLDFTSGIGVNSLGLCYGPWVQAVQRQAAAVAHVSNLYYTQPDTLLAKELCERSGCSKVFFANSGAEANEGMIKAARKYNAERYGEGARSEILALENSFHGRTITTLSATGQAAYHRYFGPFTPGFSFARANDARALREKISKRTGAILLELVQGEGGVVPLEQGFADEAARLCREYDLLLLVDEVQTGAGRTGSFLACEQYGLKPDLVSLAKGLGGGLPLGAVLLYEKCADTLGPGDHGSTFGGNPIACAGARAVLHALTPQLLEEVARKGRRIAGQVRGFSHVRQVDGLGLMLGVSFENGITGAQVARRCLEHGVLFLTAKEKLRMLPALNITDGELDEGLAVLGEVLHQWE